MKIEIKMIQKNEDIVLEILMQNPELKGNYYLELDNQTDGHVETASFRQKLYSLEDSLTSHIRSNTLTPQTMVNVLSAIEEYVMFLKKLEDKNEIDDTFFDGFLATLSNIKDTSENYRYVQLFKGHVGSSTEKHCKKYNADFWKVIMG